MKKTKYIYCLTRSSKNYDEYRGAVVVAYGRKNAFEVGNELCKESYKFTHCEKIGSASNKQKINVVLSDFFNG